MTMPGTWPLFSLLVLVGGVKPRFQSRPRRMA
jgi:hypothetical protein